MTWTIDRDADGLPVRMVWAPDEPRQAPPEPARCACGMEPPFHRRDCEEVREVRE